MSRSANGRAAPPLTPRELEVLRLVAQGFTSADIARELWITPETVQTHVKRTLRRLGARTRAHAVTLAFERDLWNETAS